jgi:hypothetical protein
VNAHDPKGGSDLRFLGYKVSASEETGGLRQHRTVAPPYGAAVKSMTRGPMMYSNQSPRSVSAALCNTWALPLRSLPHDLFEHLVRRAHEASVFNLVVRDQTAIQSLPERLADETRFDCARVDKVEYYPQRPVNLKHPRLPHSGSGTKGPEGQDRANRMLGKERAGRCHDALGSSFLPVHGRDVCFRRNRPPWLAWS